MNLLSEKIKAPSAKKSITCCNCEVSLAQLIDEKESLYRCVMKDCSKYGETLCQDCGASAHKRKNHKFDIKQDYIKTVDLRVVEQKIKDGYNIIQQTFSAQNDKKKEDYRVAIYSISSSVVHPFLIIEETIRSGIVKTAATTVGTMQGATVCTGLSTVLMLAQETMTQTMRFMTGEIITWKEYGYHMAKGWTTAIGSGLGSWTGFVGGAKFGTIIGGPIGTIIGAIVGGMTGNILGSKLTRDVFDTIYPGDFIQNEQIGREQMIRDSLKLFGFTNLKDIENPAIFNDKELKTTYHRLAKRYHPDKNGGTAESHKQFQEIVAAFGVLLNLLEKEDKKEVVRRLGDIRAIKWKNDIQQLSNMLKQKKLMYIVDICTRYNQKLNMSFLAEARKEEILELLKKINEDKKQKYNIKVTDRMEFANIIGKWSKCSNDWIWGNDDQKEQEEKEDYDDIEYDEMEELRDELRKKKLLDIAKVCEEYNEEYSLESLLEYRKHDILEVIDEINNDETNKHKKISVGRKNQFAKIICTFAQNQCELCVSK